jgi:hypothetical protein
VLLTKWVVGQNLLVPQILADNSVKARQMVLESRQQHFPVEINPSGLVEACFASVASMTVRQVPMDKQ